MGANKKLQLVFKWGYAGTSLCFFIWHDLIQVDFDSYTHS